MNNKLSEAMAQAKITDTELAQVIGADRTTIYHYKRGATPSLIRALKIARALNVRVEDIFLLNNVQNINN